MRLPLSWLAELVDLPPAGALAERLTMAGLKVESMERVGALHADVRVGRLLEVAPHPQADRLHVCRLDVGMATPATVVSAAPGLAAGQHVAVALPGATLADGRVVAAADLRGVASEGVLCSAAELGLFDESDRVLALDDAPAPGARLVELPGVADVVVELEITANRGDWLSVLGVAREVAALTGTRCRPPTPRVRERGAAAGEAVSVVVEAPDLCARYAARVVRGVRIGPSPFAVRLRLSRAGMRPISNVVDATNYVMLETGQPLHAFDLARLDGRIVARRARPGERMTTLDGVERALVPDDLVIADGARAVALAGVMGGQDSEVGAGTTDLLLESAWFAPGAVRKTSRRLALPSQAAYRFERRVDPAGVPLALDAVAARIAQVAGGQVAPGVVEDAPGLAALAPRPVRIRPSAVSAALGVDVGRADVAKHLRALGATVQGEGAELVVTPPTWRGDVAIPEDVVEEVARLVGYENVAPTLPLAPSTPGGEAPVRAAQRRARALCVAEGLTELVSLTFVDAELNRRVPGLLGAGLEPLVLVNPLSGDYAELRRSPLASLVRALRLNLAQGVPGMAAFELGRGYGRDGDGTRQEPRALALLLCGTWPARGLERSGPAMDFADLKGALENVLAGLGWDDRIRWRAAVDVPFLHPGKAARLTLGDRVLGVAGALHPEVTQACDLPQEVWVAEVDFHGVALYEQPRIGVRSVPRFPAVSRDIAVIVDDDFPADAILEEIRAVSDPLIESASVFDCYRGAPIPSGRKSLAYTIGYRAADRTLTDDEVNALHAQIRERLRARFALELRS